MQRKYLWLFAFTAAPLATLACANILGFERLDVAVVDGGAPQADAALDAPITIDAGTDTAPPVDYTLCDRVIPAQPEADASGPEGNIFFQVAFRDAKLGATEVAGFNLDRRCTTSVATSGCVLNTEAARSETLWNDGLLTPIGPRGADNASAKLIGELIFPEFSQDRIAQLLQQGAFGIGATVTGYNGQKNDQNVRVYLMPFVRVQGGLPDGGVAFDARDNWRIDSQWATGGGQTDFDSADAYVRDGTLYATFREFIVRIPISELPGTTPPLVLRFTDVAMSADVVGTAESDGGVSYALRNGRLGGRWSRSDILRSIAELRLAILGGGTVCASSYMSSVVKIVCANLDLAPKASDPERTPCDAFSGLLTFDSYSIGKTADESDAPDAGAATCTDPAIFRCPCDPDAGVACPQ